MNNIVKHANASQVQLELVGNNVSILLRISDNGQGFESLVTKPGHFGLENMQSRAESIHAQLEISSLLNEGTTVTLIWEQRQDD